MKYVGQEKKAVIPSFLTPDFLISRYLRPQAAAEEAEMATIHKHVNFSTKGAME